MTTSHSPARAVSTPVPSHAGQAEAERGRGPGVPLAQPPLGGLQLPRGQGPQGALGPDDLRVRQQCEGEGGKLGQVPRPRPRQALQECVQQNSDAQT